jgi:hypothetical protein
MRSSSIGVNWLRIVSLSACGNLGNRLRGAWIHSSRGRFENAASIKMADSSRIVAVTAIVAEHHGLGAVPQPGQKSGDDV